MPGRSSMSLLYLPRRPLRALACIAALTLAACGSGGSTKKTATPSPTPPPAASAVPGGPGTPPAAGIAGTPLAPSITATQPAGRGAEAALRRIALFSTDFPPGMMAKPPLMEAPDTTEARVPNPQTFRQRAGQWNRIATFYTGFTASESSPPAAGPRAAGSSAAWFADEAGARSQFDALRAGGLSAVQEAGLLTLLVPLDNPSANTASTPSGVGDEALAWSISAGQTSGAMIAFRQGQVVGTVVVLGTNEATALAERLATRAKDAQQP